VAEGSALIAEGSIGETIRLADYIDIQCPDRPGEAGRHRGSTESTRCATGHGGHGCRCSRPPERYLLHPHLTAELGVSPLPDFFRWSNCGSWASSVDPAVTGACGGVLRMPERRADEAALVTVRGQAGPTTVESGG
jgi:hypothetical protein